MAGPRKKFRQRPKKVGAKKRTRVKHQKQKLVAAGVKEEDIHVMTDVDVRGALKKAMRKKGKKTQKGRKSKKGLRSFNRYRRSQCGL